LRSFVGMGVILLLIIASVVTFFWDVPSEYIIRIAEKNIILASLFFMLLMFVATVVAPVTATPAIPIATTILPPMLVGALSVIGWGLGAMLAFIIARRYGKPILSRFVSLDEVERYEKKIPERLEFFTLILLRMVIPVDVLSYAVGLVSSIRFLPYSVATFIGITPFSFIFAYGGSAFFEGRYVSLLLTVGGGVVLFLFAWYILKRHVS